MTTEHAGSAAAQPSAASAGSLAYDRWPTMGWLKQRIIEDMEPKQEPPMSAREHLFETVYAGGEDAVKALHDYLESRAEMVDRVTDAFAKRRWIPVTERLPDDRQHVIACFPSPLELMTHAVYEKDPGWFSIPNYGAAQASHWMPFPDPPTDAK